MTDTRLFKMQQEQYEQAEHLRAQIADLTEKFLHQRVRAAPAGMLSRAHRRKYSGQTGVVSRILVGQGVAGLEVAWEDGSTSNSLPYMVTLA